MKKTYEKPRIMFEDFALNTCIAAACQTVDNFNDEIIQRNCEGYYLDGFETVIFTSETTGCWTAAEPDGQFNSMCYHVPTISLNLQES